METLLCAIGFVLVLEGFLPLIAPDFWKKAILEVARFPSETLRNIGFVSVGLGLVVIYLTNWYFDKG